MSGLLQKLKLFMDENRRNQQSMPGWHERLRDIYVAHQRQRDRNSALRNSGHKDHVAKK